MNAPATRAQPFCEPPVRLWAVTFSVFLLIASWSMFLIDLPGLLLVALPACFFFQFRLYRAILDDYWLSDAQKDEYRRGIRWFGPCGALFLAVHILIGRLRVAPPSS